MNKTQGGSRPGLGITLQGRFYRFPNWLSVFVRQGVMVSIARLLRGATLGVQALAYDDEGRVLLIRQSYTDRWQFPGGGVDRGESLVAALIRELKEEADAEPATPPRLFGVYTNFSAMRGDHVALFIIDRVSCPAFPPPNAEIIAHGFFAPNALPEDTAGSVRRRLAEVAGAPVAEVW